MRKLILGFALAALAVSPVAKAQHILTTGTTPAGGVQFTITFANARLNRPNCVFNSSTSAVMANSGGTTTTANASTVSALSASANYNVTYFCGGY